MRYKACILSMLLFSGNLLATTNPCSSGTGYDGYSSGYMLQQNVVRYLWEYNFHKDCQNLEAFIKDVNVSFVPGYYQGDYYLQCRDTGMMDGLSATLNEIQNECAIRCVTSGSSIGEFTGKQYCMTAKGSTLKSPEPPKLCDTVSQQACRSALQGYVNSFPDCKIQSEQDPYFNGYLDTACDLMN